jgi:inward rectifier potassium channel
MKKKLTKRKQNRVSVHAGQVEFVKVNVGGRQWREVYQWLLALRWPQFAALVATVYIALNLLFATLYSLDREKYCG